MAEEITTPETRPDGDDVTPADGGGTGSDEVANLKDVLGEVLGKEFKSDEDAVAYVKANESFTGKWKNYRGLIEPLEQKLGSQSAVNKLLADLQMAEEQPKPQEQTPPVVPPVPPEAPKPEGDYVPKSQYEADRFFEKNPSYAAHRELLTSLSKAEGKTLPETVELPAFKTIFEKAQKGDEFEKSRSVLHSNPRLGASADKISKARDASKAGDEQQARSLAVGAVMDITEQK